jgi:hypothetical protein
LHLGGTSLGASASKKGDEDLNGKNKRKEKNKQLKR